MRYRKLYNSEYWQTRSTWTISTKFLAFGAMEAQRQEKQEGGRLPQVKELIAPAIVAYISPTANESPERHAI